jgi:hypothetical protein
MAVFMVVPASEVLSKFASSLPAQWIVLAYPLPVYLFCMIPYWLWTPRIVRNLTRVCDDRL